MDGGVGIVSREQILVWAALGVGWLVLVIWLWISAGCSTANPC